LLRFNALREHAQINDVAWHFRQSVGGDMELIVLWPHVSGPVTLSCRPKCSFTFS